MDAPLGRYVLTAAGHRVRVWSGGPPAGRPIVLVHGIGVSSRYFRRLATDLTTTHRVHVPDLPGFGGSPRPRRILDVAELAEVLTGSLRALGARRPVLVGHSMGCQIITLAAVMHPDAIGPLVLLGPTVDPVARSAVAQAGRLLRDVLVEPPAINALVLSDYLRCGPRRFAGTLRAMLDDRIEERIGFLSSPVLVVRGGRDPIAPRRWASALADAAPAGRLVEIPGAGHVVQHVAAAEVAALCRGL